uniref:Heme NO-binding domain-containing protein n=1 Tax=Acrobeloides nanus TaxID=290746 RepID=A0A914D7X9_9BILA
MIGLIHHSLKVMVLELFGLELWETVLRENNIDIDIEFAALEYYPDGPLVALVVSLSKNLGVSIDDCLYKFGVWIIPYLIENGYKEHISCLGGNLKV